MLLCQLNDVAGKARGYNSMAGGPVGLEGWMMERWTLDDATPEQKLWTPLPRRVKVAG
jgi:hypothetical protein